jgi:drug/metabolite transporter (DMT)-like permease
LITPVSSMALVLGGSVIGSFGMAFLKSGALVVRRTWSSILFNWRLAVGVAAYLVSSVFYVKGISNGELSVLFPMVSLGYVCTLLWARLFFNEKLTAAKFAGVGLILLGIVCMSFGNK